jgi:hypothetical protein
MITNPILQSGLLFYSNSLSFNSIIPNIITDNQNNPAFSIIGTGFNSSGIDHMLLSGSAANGLWVISPPISGIINSDMSMSLNANNFSVPTGSYSLFYSKDSGSTYISTGLTVLAVAPLAPTITAISLNNVTWTPSVSVTYFYSTASHVYYFQGTGFTNNGNETVKMSVGGEGVPAFPAVFISNTNISVTAHSYSDPSQTWGVLYTCNNGTATLLNCIYVGPNGS